MPIARLVVPNSSTAQLISVRTCRFAGTVTDPAVALEQAQELAKASSMDAADELASLSMELRNQHPTITPASPNPQLQFTASFAPAATPCELHPTSAHPPHSTSHHRECCPPVRLTLCIPERMVHA